MKQNLLPLCLLLAACSATAKPPPAPTVISAADFGAIPNDGQNDLPALRQAVAAAVKTPGCRLVIPPGRYDLADADAVALQAAALGGKMGTNFQDVLFNRDFKYVTALDFTGADKVTVEAKGVEFLVDGWMEPVSLQQCRGVTLNGLTIDFKRPPNSEGQIIAVGNGTVDVKFADWCPVTPDMPFLRMMVYDGGAQSLAGESFGAGRPQLVAPQTLRFPLRNGQCQVGRVLLCWHGFHFRPAILLYGARDTVMNDITLHANPGMGVVGHLSDNITMNRLRVVPAAGRHISTNTDATHFVSCRGLVRFDHCAFAGQGDDATNLHGFYTDILTVQPGNRCVLATPRRFETHSVKRDFPRIGDTLALVRRATLEEAGYVRVKSVELSEKDWSYTITYEGDMPADNGNYLVANVTALPALEFVNCQVRSHRARTVLVKTRKVLIEGCSIQNSTGTAIDIAAEGNWMEGVCAADVVVRNNQITHCGLGGPNDGTIDGASAVSVEVNAPNRGVPGLIKRLLIENNTITGGHHAISIRSAGDVTVRGNTFREIRSDPVRVQTSERVWVTGNQGAPDAKLGAEPALPVLH